MNTRLNICWLVAAMACMLLVPSVAAEAPRNGPFSDVPAMHWSYDAVMQTAQNGIFNGYPDGTFAGNRSLTRYGFAVAVQRMVQEIQRDSREGAMLSRHLRTALAKLVGEYSPELAMLGTDVAVLDRSVRTLTSPWLGDAPDLATCSTAVYPGVGTPEDQDYHRGARLAAQEWQRGEVVFCIAPSSRSPRISASSGVLYRVIDTRADAPGRLALISGHNAEVKRRLEQFGPPASARPAWVEAVLHTEQPWRAGLRAVHLDTTEREATAAAGQLLLGLEKQRRGSAPRLHVTTPERTQELPLPDFDLNHDTLEVCPTSANELLHLAHRRPGEKTVRVWVVDLQSGRTLNQVDVPAAALRSTPAVRPQKIYPALDDRQ